MSFAKLESFILEKMSATHLPGVSMAIIEGKEVIWSRGLFRANKRSVVVTRASVGELPDSATALPK